MDGQYIQVLNDSKFTPTANEKFIGPIDDRRKIK